MKTVTFEISEVVVHGWHTDFTIKGMGKSMSPEMLIHAIGEMFNRGLGDIKGLKFAVTEEIQQPQVKQSDEIAEKYARLIELDISKHNYFSAMSFHKVKGNIEEAITEALQSSGKEFTDEEVIILSYELHGKSPVQAKEYLIEYQKNRG